MAELKEAVEAYRRNPCEATRNAMSGEAADVAMVLTVMMGLEGLSLTRCLELKLEEVKARAAGIGKPLKPEVLPVYAPKRTAYVVTAEALEGMDFAQLGTWALDHGLVGALPTKCRADLLAACLEHAREALAEPRPQPVTSAELRQKVAGAEDSLPKLRPRGDGRHA